MDQKGIDSYLEKMSENRISFDVSGLPLQFRTSKNQFNSGLVTLNNHCKVLNKLNVKGFVTWIMPTNNELTYLKNLSIEGLLKRLNKANFNEVSEIYQNRLSSELEIINDMGFPDYFLVVWDYIKFGFWMIA